MPPAVDITFSLSRLDCGLDAFGGGESKRIRPQIADRALLRHFVVALRRVGLSQLHDVFHKIV